MTAFTVSLHRGFHSGEDSLCVMLSDGHSERAGHQQSECKMALLLKYIFLVHAAIIAAIFGENRAGGDRRLHLGRGDK